MKYKILLFDLDGTISDSKEGVTNSVAYALESFGIKPPNKNELQKFLGPPLQKSFPKFYNFNEEETSLAISKYREYYEKYGLYQSVIYPKVSDCLFNYKNNGYKIALATSKPEVFAKQIIEEYKINDCFDAIIGASLDSSLIHKSDIIAKAKSVFSNSPAKDFIMIGDREHDIIGAKQNKIDSVGALWGYGDYQELSSHNPNYLISSITELNEII